MKIKFISILALASALFSCGGAEKTEAAAEDSTAVSSGTIKIDGSSTVYPISAGLAELFGDENPDVKVLVAQSGTGGGFKKFATGEIDLSDASRPIKDAEGEDCAKNNIKYQQLTIAYDGLTIVVNPKNKFVDKLTVEELKKIWENSATKAMTWADVRPTWPKDKINLYGPGTASGTYDYFKEEIVGKEGSLRTDFNSSENDNMLVKGVADDVNALGYFGFAYYIENKGKLKVVPVDGGKGAITPSLETIMDKSYAPLSRPIFIYVSDAAIKKPEVKAFVDFYLANVNEVAKTVGYIPMTDAEQKEQVAALNNFVTKK